MVRGFFIHVVAADVLLFNIFNTEQLNNSQDPPSLILTSSAIFPTSRNIYLVLTKSCIILSKDNYASPAANFPFSLGQTSGLQGWTNCPGMLLGKWTISQGPWWKKILGREFFLIHIHMQIYVFLGHMAWNLLRIPCWCLVLLLFIPIIFFGTSVM